LDATNYVNLTYCQFGSSGTFHLFDAQSFNDWGDMGSTADLSNLSSGSTPIHRWYSPETTSWVISNASPRSATYWEQFKPTISVVAAGASHTDLDATNYVNLTYCQFGSSGTSDLFDTQSFNDWVDIGSTANLSNPSSGLTPAHRWYCLETTSWVINNASPRSATYWEQFEVTITATGLSSSHPATITFVQSGIANNSTTSAIWSDWADTGSTLGISKSVEGGWTGDWSTGDITSWTVDSAISATVGYERSYLGIYILAGALAGAIVVGSSIFLVIRRRRAAPSYLELP